MHKFHRLSINPIKAARLGLSGLFLLAAVSPFHLLNGTIIEPACAAAKKGARRAAPSGGGGGGGGGSVMLSTPNPTNPLEWNNRAVELGNKGLWADAIKHHEEAIRQLNPFTYEYDNFKQNLSGACLRFGDKLMGQKKYYEASVQYRKALYADPNNDQADRQLDMCLKALGKDPDNPAVRRNIGETAETEGRYGTAIVEYRKVVRMKDDGPSHYDLARALRKEGGVKDVDALQELKIAITKSWSDKVELAKCHTTLGDLLWEYAKIARDKGSRDVALKRLNNAAISYRRAVTLNPSLADAIQGLKEVARESVAISPSFDNHLMLAGAYQLSGDFPHAKLEFEACWKANPNHPSLAKARRSYHMAVVTSAMSTPAELMQARQKAEDSLKQNNEDPEMLFIYGKALERTGDTARAVQAYKAAYQRNPYVHPDLGPTLNRLTGQPIASADPNKPAPPVMANAGAQAATGAAPGAAGAPGGTQAPAGGTAAGAPAAPVKDPTRFAKAQSLMRSGDLEGAQKELDDLTMKDPRDGKAWYMLGTLLQKKDDLDGASACYRQAFNLGDKEAKGAMRLVDTQRVQDLKKEAEKKQGEKNWVAAASSWREAATLAPYLSFVHRNLAVCLKEMGDAPGAEKEQKKADELDKEDREQAADTPKKAESEGKTQ